MNKLEEFETNLARHRRALALTCDVISKYRLRLVPGGFWEARWLFRNLIIRYPRKELWSLVALDSSSHWLRAELKGRKEFSDSVFVQAIAHCHCFTVLERPAMKDEVWEALLHNANLANIHSDVNMSFEGQGKLGAFLAICAVPRYGIAACLDPKQHGEIMRVMSDAFPSKELIAMQENTFRQFTSSILGNK